MPTQSEFIPGSLNKTTRQVITPTNVKELEITEDILNKSEFTRTNRSGQKVMPIGISFNETIIGNKEMPSANTLGWIAYLDLGVPLIEEFANITPIPPDTLGQKLHANYSPRAVEVTETINFTIENTITWNLTGESRLTFQGRVLAYAEGTAEEKEAYSVADKNSPNNTGVDITDTIEGTLTEKIHTEGEFYTQLQLAITGAIGGSLKISAQQTSSYKTTIMPATRSTVLTTQRRLKRQMKYTIPVTLFGIAALLYPEEVKVLQDPGYPNPYPENGSKAEFSKVIPFNLQKLKWGRDSKQFCLQGFAESISSSDVQHIFFNHEMLSDNPDYPPALTGKAYKYR